jgi:hypothetical protein
MRKIRVLCASLARGLAMIIAGLAALLGLGYVSSASAAEVTGSPAGVNGVCPLAEGGATVVAVPSPGALVHDSTALIRSTRAAGPISLTARSRWAATLYQRVFAELLKPMLQINKAYLHNWSSHIATHGTSHEIECKTNSRARRINPILGEIISSGSAHSAQGGMSGPGRAPLAVGLT